MGTVAKSKSDKFKEGDEVICSGYKLGMSVNGGFGSLICVPASWVVSLPNGMSDLEAMSYGVAGLTSAACVKSIIDKGVIDTLPIAVSGATGGVGSVAAGILNKIGFFDDDNFDMYCDDTDWSLRANKLNYLLYKVAYDSKLNNQSLFELSDLLKRVVI